MSLHYYPIINRMINLSGLRNQAVFFKKDLPPAIFSKPFITVCREPGSGGAVVAQIVAQKLGFEFVDEQIIEDLSFTTKKRKKIISSIDEKARTKIEDLVHSLFNKDYVSDYKYISELSKIILTYAHQGHKVILGRGANFLTPSAKGLHVRITAPLPIRQIRAVKFEGHTEQEAKEIIAKTEKDRVDFVKKYFKKDIKHASHYDLVLNTAFISLEGAADIIVEAFYKKFSLAKRYKSIL